MARKFVDKDTGEILEEPDFIKVYIQDLCNVKSVTGLQMNIFHFMMRNMNSYNEVSYGKSAKERFCAEHGTTISSFDNNIKALISKGLIERVSRGEFRINKKYAVKTDWEKVQFIEWKTTYTRDGKKEEVTFKEE